MRRSRLIFMLIICLVALALSACSGGASLSGILSQKGVTDKPASGMSVQIRFLQESKGSNFKSADVSSNLSFLGQLLGLMQASRPAKAPDGQYTPELRSDCEIVFTDSKGNAFSVYYAAKDNYLIYPERKADKSGETIEYLYFTPDTKLASLIDGQKQNAALQQSDEVKPFRSMEELKSSIDPDELAEAGTDIDFEFFTDATPENTGTACRVYTSGEFPAIPQDSYLITAYGKAKNGQQEKLSVTAISANSNYTKITVEPPDDTADSVDSGDTPPSYAVTVKKDAVDPGKWIVFVDDSGNILDVILPEDIAAVPSGQPSVSPAPTGASAAPTATEEPPEGGPEDTGGGSADND